jgi:dihydrofolate synthase/folylpolyglutamate synthase
MSFLAAVERLDALGLELAPTTPRRKFDLDHMRILARALGDPQTRFPSVLIAGTNGKGSTASTLAAILAAAGLRTGLYTSPHLTRVTERIRTTPDLRSSFTVDRSPSSSPTDNAERTTDNGLPEISEEAFARLYFHVDTTAAHLVATGQLPHHPSYFETLTALAFLYFAEQHLDIAVLEVGLGGRLDATNIVEPLLSVITDIALDHQEYLGSTLAEIAREKAGILRPNGTLITLPQHPEANRAIGEAAVALNVRAISATPYLPNVERSPFSVDRSQPTASPSTNNGQRTTDNQDRSPLPLNHYTLHIDHQPLHVRSPLPGEHQRRNLALAIAAALELRRVLRSPFSVDRPRTAHPSPSTGNVQRTTVNVDRTPVNDQPPQQQPITISAIERGIANTSWPGRLEFLPPNLLLDVAHNPAGAWTLRAAIAALPETLPRTLIFSCLRDKDLREMSQILFPLFDPPADVLRSPFPVDRSTTTPPATNNVERTTYNLILTPIDSPRAASLESLTAAARALDIPAHAAPSPAAALDLARALTPPPGLILATGSVYLIGALRSLALPSHT